MRGMFARARRAPALAAILALLCQVVLAVPVAERMALERIQMPMSAHADCTGMAGMGAQAAGKPATPAHPKHDHQFCPFCATAALFGLSTPGLSALDLSAWTVPRAAFPSALFLPAYSDCAHQSRAPPQPAIV